LPPAWTDVFINPSPSGMLQAIGKDAAGRWQYRYHEIHNRKQDQKKFDRLIRFAEALPKMRQVIARDLSKPGFGREKVLAGVLRILSTSFLRPGSQVYADENGHYGIATLRPKHVKVTGDRVIFDFPGKSGVRQYREIKDKRVARLVRALLKNRPRNEVFKYQDDEGNWVNVKRTHINEYIKEIMGNRFSAKDFRTWAGTLVCACALARAGVEEGDGQTARKKKVVEAIKETAEILGNTPAVCRSSYISPDVFSSYEKGKIIDEYFDSVEEMVSRRTRGLHSYEKSLLRLLKRKA
jgi:DNA topoisomerase-1